MKTCSECKCEKPISDFGTHARQKDGLQRNCKQCQRNYFAAYRAKNPHIVAANAAKHRAENRTALRERLRAFVKSNPEKGAIYSKTYREKHPERRKAICAKYRAGNIERERAYRKLYASKNPDKLAARASLRRALKLMATPDWADTSAIAEKYGLAMRVTKEFGVAYHVDHIVPLASKFVCGLHWEYNLRVIPGVENLSKGNRTWPNMWGSE